MALNHENYFIITNNCQAVSLYKILGRAYDTPFIGHYIQDDFQYLKLCENIYKYLKKRPVFGKPLLKQDTLNPDYPPESYPTMFLGDIEIDWLHEKDEKVCLEKFNRRLQRSKGKIPFFIWGDSLLHNRHSEKDRQLLIQRFEALPNSLYLRKEYSIHWKDKSFDDRNNSDGFACPVPWLKYDVVNSMIMDYFHSGNKPNII